MNQSEVLSQYMAKKVEFLPKFQLRTALEFYEGWLESLKPPYSQANLLKKHMALIKPAKALSVFQNSGHSRCHTPKMSHYATTCDVIGHDVMVESDIPNERTWAELYGSEVSLSKRYWIRICSRLIAAKSCQFLAKSRKTPRIRGGELWMVPLKS